MGRAALAVWSLPCFFNDLLPKHALGGARNLHHSILVQKALKIVVMSAGSGSSRVFNVVNAGKVDLEDVHDGKSMSVDVSFTLRVDKIQVFAGKRGAVLNVVSGGEVDLEDIRVGECMRVDVNFALGGDEILVLEGHGGAVDNVDV